MALITEFMSLRLLTILWLQMGALLSFWRLEAVVGLEERVVAEPLAVRVLAG
jgi:hypothetical protein